MSKLLDWADEHDEGHDDGEFSARRREKYEILLAPLAVKLASVISVAVSRFNCFAAQSSTKRRIGSG